MSKFGWRGPYRWRTNVRSKAPWFMNTWFAKGKDCEAAGGAHQWYNVDNFTSGCYHCNVVRDGQLWRNSYGSDVGVKDH